jgi:peptidoglycan/LPS O-acetylase OafA/YrhL
MNISWSLAIEEQFYLLYPAIVLWVEKRTLTKILIAAVLLAPFFRVFSLSIGSEPGTAPYVRPFCRLDDLAMGALAQIALKSLSPSQIRRFAKLAPLLSALAILSLLIWDRTVLPMAFFGYSLTGLASAALLLAVLTSDPAMPVRRLFANRMLVYVSKLSYGLYLLHLMAHAIVDRLIMSRLPANSIEHLAYSSLRVLSVTAVALFMATISYYFFEVPILRLKDRLAPVKERFHAQL